MTSKPEQVAFEAWWDAEQRKSFARAYGPAEPFRDGWNSGSKRSAQEAWMARAEHHETAAEPCVFYAHDEPRVYLICADDESEALARLREVAPGADDDDIKRFGRGKAVIVFNEPEPPSAFVSQDRFENDDGSRSPGTPNFLEDAYHRALDKLVMSRTFMTLEAQQAFDEEWGRSMRSAVKTSCFDPRTGIAKEPQ